MINNYIYIDNDNRKYKVEYELEKGRLGSIDEPPTDDWIGILKIIDNAGNEVSFNEEKEAEIIKEIKGVE